MFAKPQSEHAWLEQLVGEWTVESECRMAPDQPPMNTTSQVKCRTLRGMWILVESEGELPQFGAWTSIMTLGYNPEAKQYVGSFVGSMMTHLWLYTGSIGESGKLVLDSEGPKFDNTGTAHYQDIIEIVDADHWILSSQILGDDGTWIHFMTAHHRRQK